MNLLRPIVSAEWLKTNLSNRDLIILDATLPKVSHGANHPSADDSQVIPGARIFDLKNIFKNGESPYPNTVPTTGDFEKAVRALGISKYSLIVIYDRHGVYSAARAWWLFRLMGHHEVAVLNGGLPAWKVANYALEDNPYKTFDEGDFIAHYQKRFFVDYQEVLAQIPIDSCQVLDARSEGRFNATAPEPRKGLRGGHIPSSKSLPYTQLIKDGKLIPLGEIKATFDRIFTGDKLIFSCGSGITACILAVAASAVGIDDYAVFDGSWTEWGMREELPIEK